MGIIASILLLIDGVIYNAIKYLYNIFDFMAGLNIFNNKNYEDISYKIYVILGLIMMFILAYSLLRAVMNPDDFAKGEKSFPSLIKNIIISLALIVVMPAIFSFAMDFQAAILDNNTIYKFILGREDLEESNVDIGSQIAYYTFTSFFYPSEEFCTDGSGGMTTEQAESCKNKIKSNGSTWYRPSTWFTNDQITLAEYDVLIESGQASFTNYNDFSNAVADNEISYSMIISTIAGVFVLYVLINFCFDVAVRVIKLAFYQLIAPIPIICRILPGGNMKDVFDKWTKQTVSVYVEVFIRIAVMALGVYLIGIVIDAFKEGIPNIDSLKFTAQMIVRVLLIMAVIIFIRQAPKLIGDLFHLDTGGMKLGIMDKLAMGGGLAAGAFIGGGIGSGARNFATSIRNTGSKFKDIKAQNLTGKNKTKAYGKALLGGTAGLLTSTAAGTVSGALRGGKSGLKSKNYKDVSGAANEAITKAGEKRDRRDETSARYKANGWNYLAGKYNDAKGSVGKAFGFDPFKDLKAEQDFNNEIIKIDDNSDSVAADLLQRDAFSSSSALISKATGGDYNMAYGAMQKRVSMLGASDYSSIKGKIVEDFKGNRHQISNENQYAMYQSIMESQLKEAERKAKKYIKQQGYASDGLNQLKALNIDLGDGELQRLSKLQSDRASVEGLLKDRSVLAAHVNSAIGGPNITSLSDDKVDEIEGAYNQMDALVNNAKNDNIRIKSQYEELQRRQPPSSSK